MADKARAGRRIASYTDFWPFYLREHSRLATRNIHFVGTAVALLSACAGLVTGQGVFLPITLAAGDGPAWFAHFFVEKNRPATFTYPLWSLISDFRIAWCWLSGSLSKEILSAGATDSRD